MIDNLLLSTTRVTTFSNDLLLTNATGFFFAREERLFLVTSRHVMIDSNANHAPNRLEIEIHNNSENLAESIQFSIPLYYKNSPNWLELNDSDGKTDIAVIEIFREALPEKTILTAFTPNHLPSNDAYIEVGSRLLIVVFPLGFQDTLHHSAVVRQAGLASAFGLRFQGQGFFLTDARTHRGSSGAPVVMRLQDEDGKNVKGEMPYLLLGIHSSRFDVKTRDLAVDEALGLNCAWYTTDILMTLTEKS